MNTGTAELTLAGKTKFHYRSGTHDDRLWALTLAIYGSRHEFPSYHPFVAFGHISKHPWDRPKIIYPIAGAPTPSNSSQS